MAKYGRVFRTRAGKLGRYVYRGGKRVGFEVLRSAGRGAKRYIAYKTYDTMKTYGTRKYLRRRFKRY